MKLKLLFLSFIMMLGSNICLAQNNLTEHLPLANATNVLPTYIIKLTFDFAPSVSEINADNIIITGSQSGSIGGVYATLSSSPNVVTFDSARSFYTGEIITVSVTTGIGVLNPTIFEFTVKASPDSQAQFKPLFLSNAAKRTVNDIVTADLDGDGDLDFLTASSSTIITGQGDVSWYKNDGSNKFAQQDPIHPMLQQLTDYRSVHAADLDGDGDLDVLSASFEDTNNTVAWYENMDGLGQFSDQKTIIKDIAKAIDVTAADLDGDGDIDVISAFQGDNKVVWFRNDGNGNFSTQNIISATAYSVRSIATADLDNDGDIDVLSASKNDNTVAWYRNDGKGNFSTQVITNTADEPTEVITADIDGDGNLDVLSISTRTNTAELIRIDWYKNNGNGGFGAKQSIYDVLPGDTAGTPLRIRTADMDGDGDLDLIASMNNVALGSANSIAWFKNNGTGVFGALQDITSTLDVANALTVSDLDNDGDVDIVYGMPNDNRISWIENTPLPLTVISTNPSQNEHNVDTAQDITAIFTTGLKQNIVNSNTVRIHGSNGPVLNFIPNVNGTTLALNPNRNFFPGEKVTTTFTVGLQNVDSEPLTSSYVTQFTAAVNPSSPGQFIKGQRTITTEETNIQCVSAADIDGDGKIDILSASNTLNRIAWYKNNGDGTFGTQQTITTAAIRARSVTTADLDGDGDLDVISASLEDNRVAWYENTNGSGTLGGQQTISIQATGAESVVAADMDGDGDMDILSASRYNNRITLYRNQNNGQGLGKTTFAVIDISSGTETSGAVNVTTADLDGDGDLDILSASFLDNKIAWYRNNLNDGQFFGPQLTITTGALGAEGISAADLDGDGDMDVLSASANDDRIAWYKNDGTGVFSVQQDITTSADGAYDVTTADMDGDGDMDVLSASANDDRIAWYKNDGTGVFGPQLTITTGADLARSVTTADLDGDGDLDVLSASTRDNRIAWYENAAATTVLNVSSSAPNGTYKAGDVIDIYIGFSGPLTLRTSGGSPQLTLETGSNDAVVDYTPGSGTNTALLFRYTVRTGDQSSDLDYISTSALTLNGATITDASGLNVDLTLPSPGAEGSFGFYEDLVVDAALPTVITLSPLNNANDVVISDNLIITFNENMQKGSGNILVVDASNFAIVETIAVTSDNVSISNAVVTINPTTDLLKSKNYYIRIGSRALTDINSNSYQGISDQISWRFATELKAAQSITFGAIADKTFGDADFTLTATSSSQSIRFFSSNGSVATVSGNTVTIVGAGNTNIIARQSEDANYYAATDVSQSLTIAKANQVITFAALVGKTFDDAPFTLAATSDSGLALTYTSSNTTVATVSENTVTIVGVGDTTITASQSGNNNYNTATDAPQSLTVGTPSLGVDDFNLGSISMYPNPAQDQLTLQNPQLLNLEQMTIYELTGKFLRKIDLTKMGVKKVLDVSWLVNATYLVIIESANGNLTQLLIKK
jgi:hypothetical protein